MTKRFGSLTVLDKICFSIGAGELVAIVGPTGCGKTTFLNTLSKLMPATEGDILIDGEEADPRKHNISYVFQEPTCLPWRTVRDNVAYGMEVKGVPKEERYQRADQIMDLVGLASCADLYPNQVSASMMQRIAVSRAFAVRPDLLLMDEPYGQLDVKLRYYLEDELVNLWRTLGSTILFVTHNIEEAVYVAERILGYMLFAWKTVLGNVEMGPKLRGVCKHERRDTAMHYINLVGLNGFENHYPHQLSGGMKQRVGIARAYANNPEILLMDEPFGQLDAQTRIFMQHEVTRIWEQEKRTVVFVTNNIDEALFLGDRIVLMEGKLPGKIKTEHPIHLPRPREHTDMTLLELREQITAETEL
ncbi:hypothetical protein B566_EDAN018742, partial [Ephemera danica]